MSRNRPRAALLAAVIGGAGLGLGGLLWLLAGSSPAQARLEADQSRLQALRPRSDPSTSADASAADVLAHPLFSLTTGPGAVADVDVRLEGLARSPRRSAALLAIGSAPAQWLALGETRAGVTLEEVDASKAVVTTALGRKEVVLGANGARPTPAGPQPETEAPAGFRLPPPPANAPGGAP